MTLRPSPRESGFVVAATRDDRARSPHELNAAAALVSDWIGLVDLAVRNGVNGYVRRALASVSVPVPAAAVAASKDAELASVALTLALNGELRRVAGAFAAAGIETIVLKGPVLARTLYPQPELRPYGDVDVVVHPAMLERAGEVLRELGFREVLYEAEIARTGFVHAGGEEPFHRMFLGSKARSLIELHADPLQLGLRPVAEDGRWRRARPIVGLGPRALALGDEDQLVHLCVHVHKHGFSRLIWLKDLDLLARHKSDQLDWDLVSAVARDEGVAASVWFALSLARDVLGAPETPARALAPAAPIRALYEMTWPRRRVASLGMTMRRRAVQFHAAESWRGMLPTLVLMGRRRERVRLILRTFCSRRPAKSQLPFAR